MYPVSYGGPINQASHFERASNRQLITGTRSFTCQLRAGLPITVTLGNDSSGNYCSGNRQPLNILRLVGFSEVSNGSTTSVAAPCIQKGLAVLRGLSVQSGSQAVIPLLSATSTCVDRSPSSDDPYSSVSPSSGTIAVSGSSGDSVKLLYDPWSLSGFYVGTPWFFNAGDPTISQRTLNTGLLFSSNPQQGQDIFIAVPVGGELSILIRNLTDATMYPTIQSDKQPRLRIYAGDVVRSSGVGITGDPKKRIVNDKTGFIDNDSQAAYDCVWAFDESERWIDVPISTVAPVTAVIPGTNTNDTSWLKVKVANTDAAYVTKWIAWVTRFVTNGTPMYVYPSPAGCEPTTLSCIFEISTVLV